MRWEMARDDGSVRQVLHWPGLDRLDDFHRVRGGNPILFPFNARCYDRGDFQFWRAPDGVRRPMPMHGLARQGDFRVTHGDDTGFTAVFMPGGEAREAYPFDYEFAVRYRFQPRGLVCELSLHNRGSVPLPWSAGHHFYFAVPWTPGLRRSDYEIRIPAARRVRHDPKGPLVPGPELGERENLADPRLVDTIHLGLNENKVTFGETGRPGAIVVGLGRETPPAPDAAIVTWSESAEVPYYCVEPWMGPPNAPENKIGLHFVPPGQTQVFVVTVEVR